MIPIKSTQIEVATNKALDCVVLWIPIDSGVRDV